MKRALYATVAACLFACNANSPKLTTEQASADQPDAPFVQNLGSINFEPMPAEPLSQQTLINGKEVDRKEWPLTVYSSQGNSRCTANVIGPQTLIVAAHCVGNGQTATFSLPDGNSYTSTCTQGPDYNGNATADWALCLISKPVTGYKYESINQDESLVKKGDKILLMGYGCINPSGTGGNDGKLRAAESTVTGTPSGTDNDIVTEGNGALCFGDSGGPAWAYLDAEKTKRVQVSVNSRGDIRTTSYLVSVASAQAKKFISSWSNSKSQKICGVHDDAPDCRNGSVTPPSPLPPQCKVASDKFNQCLWASPRVAVTDPEGCRSAYSDLFACEETAEREDPKP